MTPGPWTAEQCPSGATAPRASKPQARAQKAKNRRKVDLYTIGVDDAKILLAARLRIIEPGPGYCHFPMDRDEEYFAQLTAEKMITKFRRGFPYREWVKTRPRNEATDVRIYGHAALKILNPNWQALTSRLEPEEKQQEEKQVQDSATKLHMKQKQKRPGKPGGFVNRW